ncbi:MAG: cytochrome c3 family protein [Planctomycetota bacterium]
MKLRKILVLMVMAALLMPMPMLVMAAHTDSGCDQCHTPHNADTTVTGAPLWGRSVTTAAFTPYDSGTLHATMDAVGGIDGSARLCMSCHDGGGGPSLGTDLSDMHPVSFVYDSPLALADGGLEDPSVKLSGLTATGTIADDMLSNDKMQCASCHDIHSSGTDKASGYLVMLNTGGALCKTCHIK